MAYLIPKAIGHSIPICDLYEIGWNFPPVQALFEATGRTKIHSRMTRLHAALGVLIAVIALLTANAAWSEPQLHAACVTAADMAAPGDANDERGITDILMSSWNGPGIGLGPSHVAYEFFLRTDVPPCPPYRPPD